MSRTATRSTSLLGLLTGLGFGLGLLTGCIDLAEPEPAADDGTSSAEASGGTTDSGPTGGTGGTDTTDTTDTTGTPTTDPDDGDTTGEPDATSTGEQPEIEEQLEGRWVSVGCEPLPQADGSTLYFLRDFTLQLQSWAITGTIFGDEACTFPLLTLDIGGGYAVVGPAEGIEGGFEADFDRSSIVLTPHVQDFVDWFDAEGCGSEPWALDVAQDVSEAGCAFVPSSPACPVEYDLVAPDGDTLYFGTRPVEGDMCSPRDRPSELGEHPVARTDG